MKRKFPPREGDLPIMELLNRANQQQELDRQDGLQTDIHFKFTCENCGERCAFAEPNKIYEEGECCKCGHKTKFTVGGYACVSKFPLSIIDETRNS